jgi:hypothetical protein
MTASTKNWNACSINSLNILLADSISEAGREDIFKPTIGNEGLHEISNDNKVCHI